MSWCGPLPRAPQHPALPHHGIISHLPVGLSAFLNRQRAPWGQGASLEYCAWSMEDRLDHSIHVQWQKSQCFASRLTVVRVLFGQDGWVTLNSYCWVPFGTWLLPLLFWYSILRIVIPLFPLPHQVSIEQPPLQSMIPSPLCQRTSHPSSIPGNFVLPNLFYFPGGGGRVFCFVCHVTHRRTTLDSPWRSIIRRPPAPLTHHLEPLKGD